MPENKIIVINTSPLLALIAATGNLNILRQLYEEVWVPYEVAEEIEAGGGFGFGKEEFSEAAWLKKCDQPTHLTPFLANALDKGEASVIQLALDRHIAIVCVDEAVGRRIARLSGLKVTGSIGILVRAKREGKLHSIKESLDRMETKGIWIGQRVKEIALREANED